ncbi:MAG TPA: DUF2442 domain-containing protein [Blastocatellia bacterium]|nr:DUF2442 domain-containing protein [Blastocatellia bacterium]
MSISTADAQADGVAITGDALTVSLADGRTITVPLEWFPRLVHATAAERENWRLIGQGEGLNWPDLDEDINIHDLLLGRRSGESRSSFQRWLEKRRSIDRVSNQEEGPK